MTNYRRRRSKPKDTTRKFVVNQKIHANEVRLIDEESQMLGIMTLAEARAIATEQDKDLVEINPKATPPVIKLIEYSKFKYQQDKAEKNKAKGGDEEKVLRVSVRISPHDLTVQAKKADEFLKKGLKVRLQVQMRGREKSHPEVASQVMIQFIGMVTEQYSMENPPKLVGDSAFAFLKKKI